MDFLLIVLLLFLMPIIIPISIIEERKLRNTKKNIRNEHTKTLESLDGEPGNPGVAYLNIDINNMYTERLTIKRQVSIKEYRALKQSRYSNKRGWQLSSYAYVLDNTCPCCGNHLYGIYQSSPLATWGRRSGSAGYLIYCPECKKDLNFYLTKMN